MAHDKDSQKKQIGELLKNADRLIKNSDWFKALDEVNKALGIEPNNMYALAYKDRINVSIAEEKKKQNEEKVKKLAEEKKSGEKVVEAVKTEPAKEEKKPADKGSEPVKTEPKESVKQETKETAKEEPAGKPKEDSSSRIESLRQEFAATQAKLQREVAQLSMQVKEAQAVKETTERNLNAEIASLQQQLASAKQNAGKSTDKEAEALKKEIETLKVRHKKEIESAREIGMAEGLAQLGSMQKELALAKSAALGASSTAQIEAILRSMFQKAWHDGVISPDERALLTVVKTTIQMPDAKFNEMEEETKKERYITALRTVWSDGHVTPEESDFLQTLRERLNVPADEHFKLESQIRKELKK